MKMTTANQPGTEELAYTRSLQTRGSVWWKQVLCVQAPYRWNIRRLVQGFVLDLGCGLGRNLAHLDGRGVGVDHNPHSVAVARTRGLQAFVPAEFAASPFNRPGRFDALLLAHVVEHMTPAEAVDLVRRHLPLVRASGQVIVICPQEAGYASDPTHVTFMRFAELRALAHAAGLTFEREYSFPFPRFVGRIFRHNEFVMVARNAVGPN